MTFLNRHIPMMNRLHRCTRGQLQPNNSETGATTSDNLCLRRRIGHTVQSSIMWISHCKLLTSDMQATETAHKDLVHPEQLVYGRDAYLSNAKCLLHLTTGKRISERLVAQTRTTKETVSSIRMHSFLTCTASYTLHLILVLNAGQTSFLFFLFNTFIFIITKEHTPVSHLIIRLQYIVLRPVAQTTIKIER